jgi:hypothetical protein
MKQCIGGIYYEEPSEDAVTYVIIDDVTGEAHTFYAEPGETCTLPGTLLAVQELADADQLLAALDEVIGV